MSRESIAETEVFKALGDPIRWNIIQQMAQQEELACSVLEDTLPVSKPTISYHTKILTQAGLIEVRKRGRNYFYSLRREVLRDLMDELWTLAPAPRLVGDGTAERAPRRAKQAPRATPAAEGDVRPAKLLTW
jgi:DNA-binding transcriptional ArsR family regulator